MLILKSWTSEERFSHHGKYWHFENIIVEPPTAQKPPPPIWMGAGSPGPIKKWGGGGETHSRSIRVGGHDRRAIQSVQDGNRKARAAVRPHGCCGMSRRLCGQGRRRQDSRRGEPAGRAATHDQPRDDGRAKKHLKHDDVCRPTRSGRGKRP